jgi:hypothetical protein
MLKQELCYKVYAGVEVLICLHFLLEIDFISLYFRSCLSQLQLDQRLLDEVRTRVPCPFWVKSKAIPVTGRGGL